MGLAQGQDQDLCVLISLDAQCPHQSVFRTVAKQQGHIINLSLYKIIIKIGLAHEY